MPLIPYPLLTYEIVIEDTSEPDLGEIAKEQSFGIWAHFSLFLTQILCEHRIHLGGKLLTIQDLLCPLSPNMSIGGPIVMPSHKWQQK